MSFAARADDAIRAVSRGMAIIAALSIAVVMLSTVLNVVVRFVAGVSVPGMLEVAQSGLVVAVFFGLAWAGVSGEHVSVRLLTDRLGGGANRVLAIVVWALSTGFVLWLLQASVVRAMDSTQRGESRFGLLEWATWPWRWVLVAGVAAFAVVAVANLVRAAVGHPVYGDETPHGDDAMRHVEEAAS